MTWLEIVIARSATTKQSGWWCGAKVAIQLLPIPAKRVPAKAGSRNPEGDAPFSTIPTEVGIQRGWRKGGSLFRAWHFEFVLYLVISI